MMIKLPTVLEFVKGLEKKSREDTQEARFVNAYFKEIVKIVEDHEDWVPVKDGLPKRKRTVQVTLEDAKGKRFVTTAKYHKDIKSWGHFRDARFYHFKVVAWKPKSKPYEGR